MRVASAEKRFHEAHDDDDEQCADKEIRGDEERNAGFPDTAEIDYGDQQQYGETEADRVLLLARADR